MSLNNTRQHTSYITQPLGETIIATKRNTQNTNKQNNTSNRGFASMDPQKQHEIASKGGHASAEQAGYEGRAEVGRKGGHARGGRSSNEDANEE